MQCFLYHCGFKKIFMALFIYLEDFMKSFKKLVVNKINVFRTKKSAALALKSYWSRSF
jgi:hypothetical protein